MHDMKMSEYLYCFSLFAGKFHLTVGYVSHNLSSYICPCSFVIVLLTKNKYKLYLALDSKALV